MFHSTFRGSLEHRFGAIFTCGVVVTVAIHLVAGLAALGHVPERQGATSERSVGPFCRATDKALEPVQNGLEFLCLPMPCEQMWLSFHLKPRKRCGRDADANPWRLVGDHDGSFKDFTAVYVRHELSELGSR